MNKPKVAVVIVHWNKQDLLEQFLPSVCQSDYDNLEICIIDNASTDNSVSYIKEHFPQIKIIELAENHGYAGGYNLGLKYISADYYILLNNDIEVPRNWINPVIDWMEKDKKIAACQPKMLDFIHRQQFEYAGACGGFIDKFGYAFCRGRIFNQLEIDSNQYDSAIDIFWATGACMFVRASSFHRAGGFDELFFAHMEEIDLCWRFQLMGEKVMVIPQSHVYHVGGGTLNKMSDQKTFLNFRNNLIMITKNANVSTLIWLIPFRATLDLISSIMFLLKGEFGFSAAVHRAHADFFFKFSKWWKLRNQVKPLIKNHHFTGWYNGSIVWQYFVKGVKEYSKISY